MLSVRWRRDIWWKQTIEGIELQFFTEPKRTLRKLTWFALFNFIQWLGRMKPAKWLFGLLLTIIACSVTYDLEGEGFVLEKKCYTRKILLLRKT